MRNSAGNVTTEIDSAGNIFLGGNGSDGDVICNNSSGDRIFHLDAQYRHVNFNDDTGTTKMRIDTDEVTVAPWPAWPGESAPSRLDLVAEIRRLKEEVLALRAEVDALSSG